MEFVHRVTSNLNSRIMKKIIFTFIVVFFAFTADAQGGKLKKADNYYSLLSYSYAAPLYEDLIGSEFDNTKMRSKLARSYYQLGDMTKARDMYATVVERSDAHKEDYFFYAQTLKQTGNYDLSDTWMHKFTAHSADDKRAISFKTDQDYVDDIKNKGERFTVSNLSINTAVADFGGYPSTDKKTVYFVSARKKRVFVKNEWSWTSSRFLDLYKSTLTDSNTLEDPEMLKRKVNTKYHEGPLCYSPDGKMVYFTRNNISNGKHRRDGNGIRNLKMYRAKIAEDGSWTDEESLPFNSKEYSVGHPSISADGKTLYFASDKPGGFGGSDLYKMAINEDGTFGEWVNLGEDFNTEGQEMFPWISADGNLFFSSDGLIGLGGLDVFVALGNDGTFSYIENVGLPVNSKNDDFAFTVEADNMHGFFSSNREGGQGDDDIYSFVITDPFVQRLVLSGLITELRSGEIIPGATVNLLDENGTVVATTTANEKGEFSFDLERGKDYTISGEKSDYFSNSLKYSTKNIDPKESKVTQNLPLEKDPGLSLYTFVTDAKTSLPLDSVQLTIIDNLTGTTFAETLTPETGDFLKGVSGKKIGDRISYNIKLVRPGYFPKEVTFNYEVKEAGMIKVHEIMMGSLTMDKEVADLRDMVEMRPIKFDYNKSTIRPDAAAELDKIVVILNKYPKMVIELAAHTDCRGSKAYNQKLSDERAKSSAAYIKSRIVNPERISGQGYGESQLVNGCACEGTVKPTCSEEEHQENRRTEFRVVSAGADVDVKNNPSKP